MTLELVTPRVEEDLVHRIAAAWARIPQTELDDIVHRALAEDIGHGDITTALTVDPDRLARGRMVAKQAGIVAGLSGVARVFEAQSISLRWTPNTQDGAAVEAGTELGRCEGNAAAMLSAERVALNIVQHMSGIATLTAECVSRVCHTQARILDTRKTMPSLRLLDKYAVVCGGGYNHRFGLSDGILIKDNHIRAAGGITAALERVRASRPHGLHIEIEVESAAQIDEALAGAADILLLDNMTVPELREACEHIGERAITEASGGISLESIAVVAETGVNFISVGRLTHSPSALDISLDFDL
jgi:nicotinate-nucleotide pyrophosphorylase (carboxylating)